MSIPKTGSRRARVCGVEYLWRIRKRPTYAQAAEGAPMTVAVQAIGARSVLIVDLGVSRPDNLLHSHGTRVTPRMVRMMIRAALAAGWVPQGTDGFALRFPIVLDA